MPNSPRRGLTLQICLKAGALREAGPAYLRAHELIISSEEYGDNGQYQVFAQRALAAANRLGAGR